MPEQTYIAGDNWLAVLAAAAAFYAIGFVIYGLLFSKQWMALSGYKAEDIAPHRWKMILSPIMPLATAIGLAIVFKLARVDNIAIGVVLGFQLWFFLALPVRLYSYVYGTQKLGLFAMDAVHLLLGYVAASAIIAGWR